MRHRITAMEPDSFKEWLVNFITTGDDECFYWETARDLESIYREYLYDCMHCDTI